MKIILAVILLSIISSCAISPKSKTADQFPVVSYKTVNADEFNTEVSTATKNLEKWAYQPLLVVYKYRQIEDANFVSVLMTHGQGEQPLTSVITIVEDGYYDDSLRGMWFRFHLARKAAQSAWQIKAIDQAYLCGRMGSPKEFSKNLCP